MMAVRVIRNTSSFHAPLPKVHALATEDADLTLCGREAVLMTEERRPFEQFQERQCCKRCFKAASEVSA